MFGGFRKGISKRMNVAEILSKNGFFTLALHSNALITTRPGYTKGFAKCVDIRHDVGNSRMKIYLKYILNDKVLAYARAEEVVERAVKEVRQLNKEKVFLWLHFMDNHHPYLPPAKFSEGMLTNPIKRARALMLFKGYGRKEATKSEKKRKKIKKLYELTVKYVDYVLGLLVEELGDDWIYIITSDHGDEFWEHGGESHQRKLYDELIRVPLIIHGVDKGKIDSLTDHTDIAPTILDIAGIKKPSVYIGESVLNAEKEYIYAENYGIYAIRDKEYKVILDENRKRVELYDLRRDPSEQVNLARDEPDILKEYMLKLERHRKYIREFELKASVKLVKLRL
jgi:arylsulfatase A-like enzyme